MTPEKLIEKLVLNECSMLQIDVDIVESKATYSKNKERYSANKNVPEGFSDLVGNDSNGLAVFIELKARGKLKTLRPKQRAFLERKIKQGCFACVVDSGEMLSELYIKFLSLPASERPKYLLSTLP